MTSVVKNTLNRLSLSYPNYFLLIRIPGISYELIPTIFLITKLALFFYAFHYINLQRLVQQIRPSPSMVFWSIIFCPIIFSKLCKKKDKKVSNVELLFNTLNTPQVSKV